MEININETGIIIKVITSKKEFFFPLLFEKLYGSFHKWVIDNNKYTIQYKIEGIAHKIVQIEFSNTIVLSNNIKLIKERNGTI